MLKFDSKMENLGNAIAAKINQKLKKFIITKVIPMCITYTIKNLVLETDNQNNTTRETDLVEDGGLIVICYDKEDPKNN